MKVGFEVVEAADVLGQDESYERLTDRVYFSEEKETICVLNPASSQCICLRLG